MQVVQSAEHAPRSLLRCVATPKFGGFPRAPTPRWRFASWRFEKSSELHEGTQKRTCVPKSSRGRPPTNEVLFGGQRGAKRRAGGMSCVLHNMQAKLPLMKRQPRVNARVSPLSREASDGGAKTRRHTFAKARWPKNNSMLQECRRVLGGLFNTLEGGAPASPSRPPRAAPSSAGCALALPCRQARTAGSRRQGARVGSASGVSRRAYHRASCART